MPDQPSSDVVNIFGRRWGRGSRPYLLVAKLLGVAAFLGGQMAILAELARPMAADLIAWQNRSEFLERVYPWVVLPGLFLAMASGFVLFISAWRAFIRMRWFVGKMLLFVAAGPILHLWTRSRVMRIDAAGEPMSLESAGMLSSELRWAALAGIVFGAGLLILGRVKPRLGQDYGRTFSRRRQPINDKTGQS